MARVRSKQDALIDELWKDCRDPKQILGQEGLLKQLTKRLVERALLVSRPVEFVRISTE